MVKKKDLLKKVGRKVVFTITSPVVSSATWREMLPAWERGY
jgi:hypothetical protein